MICVMRLSFYCGHTFLLIFLFGRRFLDRDKDGTIPFERKIKALHVILLLVVDSLRASYFLIITIGSAAGRFVYEVVVGGACVISKDNCYYNES